MSYEGIDGMITEGASPREDLVEHPGEAVRIPITDTTEVLSITIIGVRERFCLTSCSLEAVVDG